MGFFDELKKVGKVMEQQLAESYARSNAEKAKAEQELMANQEPLEVKKKMIIDKYNELYANFTEVYKNVGNTSNTIEDDDFINEENKYGIYDKYLQQMNHLNDCFNCKFLYKCSKFKDHLNTNTRGGCKTIYNNNGYIKKTEISEEEKQDYCKNCKFDRQICGQYETNPEFEPILNKVVCHLRKDK